MNLASLIVDPVDIDIKVVDPERAIMRRVDASIAHLEKAGLHLTADELQAWAAAKRLNRNTQLPACHT